MARAASLDRILEAGGRVLADRGYHGATMRDVARQAGTSLGSLYHYLSGKEDLLYQVERRVLEAAVASAQATLAARGARDRLRALLTDHIRRVLARPVEAAVHAGRLGRLRGDRGRRVDELRRAYRDLVQVTAEEALKHGRARARVRPRGREAETRTTLLLAMADALALEGASQRPTPGPGRLAGRVLRLFLEGARGRG